MMIVKAFVRATFIGVLVVLIIKCDSQNDQSKNRVRLPIVPNSGYDSRMALLPGSVDLNIVDNKIFINRSKCSLTEISARIDSAGITQRGAVLFKIDSSQKMEMVSNVMTQLRRSDYRKVVFVGQNDQGEMMEMPMLLPPMMDSNDSPFHSEDAPKNEILEIELGDDAGQKNQQLVYDFILRQVNQQSANYLVRVGYRDSDTYSKFLSNLMYVQEGFNDLYRERAMKLFGVDFYELVRKKYKGDRAQYSEVRKGVPRSITIEKL